MSEALISIIVPVFNTERYLPSCLDSILSQSYRALEVIVVNDGSSDFSEQIAGMYSQKDQRIKFFSYDHEGLSQARNHGISVATGEYIVFVDSDDILLPGALEDLFSVMNGTGADLVEGQTYRENTGKKNFINKKTISKIYTPEKAIEDLFYQDKLNASVCGKIFKKYLFDNLLFQKDVLYEDLDIIYKIFERCDKIAYTNYPVYYYRKTEGSILSSWKPQRLDVLKVTENAEQYISERYPHLLPAAKDRRLSANFNMFALCSINGEYNNTLKCWEVIRQNRKKSLLNPKVRLKNKGGILLSYLGRNLFSLIARRAYR